MIIECKFCDSTYQASTDRDKEVCKFCGSPIPKLEAHKQSMREYLSEKLLGLAFISYILLGFLQFFSIMAGLKSWLGIHWILRGILAFIVAYIPILGPVTGIMGAIKGWNWSISTSILLFTFPYVLGLVYVTFNGFKNILSLKKEKDFETHARDNNINQNITESDNLTSPTRNPRKEFIDKYKQKDKQKYMENLTHNWVEWINALEIGFNESSITSNNFPEKEVCFIPVDIVDKKWKELDKITYQTFEFLRNRIDSRHEIDVSRLSELPLDHLLSKFSNITIPKDSSLIAKFRGNKNANVVDIFQKRNGEQHRAFSEIYVEDNINGLIEIIYLAYKLPEINIYHNRSQFERNKIIFDKNDLSLTINNNGIYYLSQNRDTKQLPRPWGIMVFKFKDGITAAIISEDSNRNIVERNIVMQNKRVIGGETKLLVKFIKN